MTPALKPPFLWVVGPESVDPAAHIFAVKVRGRDATFSELDGPPPPS